MKKYESIRSKVHETLRGVLHSFQIQGVYVLGYSQGAGIALIAIEDLAYSFPQFQNKVIGYTFGSPRAIGVSATDVSPWNQTVCYRNENDIVTKVPFRWMLYQDVGVQVNIGIQARHPLIFRIQDHLTTEYLKTLNVTGENIRG